MNSAIYSNIKGMSQSVLCSLKKWIKTFVMKMSKVLCDSEATVDISSKVERGGRILFRVLKNFSVVEVTLKKCFKNDYQNKAIVALQMGRKKLVVLKNINNRVFKKNVLYSFNVNFKEFFFPCISFLYVYININTYFICIYFWRKIISNKNKQN